MMSCCKSFRSKSAVGFGLALDVLILDQVSKWLILEFLIRKEVQPNTNALGLLDWLKHAPPRWPQASIEILPFFNLTMVWNEGISFGLLHGMGLWVLVALSLLIAGLFALWLRKAEGWMQATGLGMVIGGAVGNVIDRLRFGAVADFLDFHAYGWHYPAFNAADCAITVGIALLVFDGLFLEKRRKIPAATVEEKVEA